MKTSTAVALCGLVFAAGFSLGRYPAGKRNACESQTSGTLDANRIVVNYQPDTGESRRTLQLKVVRAVGDKTNYDEGYLKMNGSQLDIPREAWMVVIGGDTYTAVPMQP